MTNQQKSSSSIISLSLTVVFSCLKLSFIGLIILSLSLSLSLYFNCIHFLLFLFETLFSSFFSISQIAYIIATFTCFSHNLVNFACHISDSLSNLCTKQLIQSNVAKLVKKSNVVNNIEHLHKQFKTIKMQEKIHYDCFIIWCILNF